MPSIRYQDNATLRAVQSVYYQDANQLRPIRAVYYQDGNTLRLVYPQLAASASPASASGAVNRPGLVTSNAVTITATGAPGTVTYSWSRVSGSTAISISSTTAATVTWSGGVTGLGPTLDAIWRCTITDTITGTTTVNVPVHLEYAP